MKPTNYDSCVQYFEKEVLPFLRHHCKLDAEHLEHNDGNNGANIRLDAPKDYKDIKRYNGIGVSVNTIYNPNIGNSPRTHRAIISGCIISSVDQWEKEFYWQSLVEMVYAVNFLKQMS